LSRLGGGRPQPPRRIGVPPDQGDSVVAALMANGRRRPATPAMWRRRRDGWESITWSDYARRVQQVAAGLTALGVGPGGRVAVMGGNSPEWHVADLAIQATGAATVPIYPTSSVAQVSHYLRHARCSVCFAGTTVAQVLEAAADAPDLSHVVTLDPPQADSEDEPDRPGADLPSGVTGFAELAAAGARRLAERPGEFESRLDRISPGDLATIVYTSGTTGAPKGAMITHSNIMWTLRTMASTYGVGEGDRLLSFLPLSHIAERMMSDFLPIAVTGETWFARSLASVADDLLSCRPTVFLAVPRVWEKMREGIEGRVSAGPAPGRALFAAYLRLGLAEFDAGQRDRRLAPGLLAAHRALDRVVGSRVRRRTGLDQARLLVSAAAPAHPDLIRWFHAVGLPVLQIYGQTEDCGPTTANRPGQVRIGTVGPPIPGVEVAVADDGEILVRGGNVCLGYLDDPAASADLIDSGGWMHTGDTGSFDPDGSLRLIGRKKDLIITAAGKNIAPQGIEIDLTNHPLLAEAVVVGEGRRYLAALIALDRLELARWARNHAKPADLESLSNDPDVVDEVGRIVDAVNSRRSRAESIRRFKILPRELTGAAGELTPTLKVRRQVISERYAGLIDELYRG